MTNRLSTIVSHLKNDAKGIAVMNQTVLVHDIMNELDVPLVKLNQMIAHFVSEMMGGLKSKEAGSELKMLPSFVYRGKTEVSGQYVALDLGGTNFRVMLVTLKDGQLVKEPEVDKFVIPPELMSASHTADELFDFVAGCVKRFVDARGVVNAPSVSLGFTFSFPVDQTEIDCGQLLTWTKGFATKNTVGKDVCTLLRSAFKRAGVNVAVGALVNDTVGTLVTGYFVDRSSEIGLIIGTGSNACYWESVPNLTKLPSPSGWSGGDEKMCINIEWGNFDSQKRRVLPRTAMDEQVDAASPNAGAQHLEKMISGMYLGEICRLILLRLVQQGAFPAVPSNMGPMSFTSANLSQVLADSSTDLAATRSLFEKLYRYKLTPEQASTLKTLFSAVAKRSARLCAAGIAAILLKTGTVRNVRVSIDGSVFEKMPGYKQLMDEALVEIMASHGVADPKIKLVLTEGGSGVGAALIAALAKRN